MTSPEPARRLPPTVLATCVLPWDDRLRFDEDAFREHVRLAAAHMTRHLYVFGTAGEGYAVTEAQFRDVARVFWDEARRCAVLIPCSALEKSLFGCAGFPAPGVGKLPQVSVRNRENRHGPAPDRENSLPQGIFRRRGSRS